MACTPGACQREDAIIALLLPADEQTSKQFNSVEGQSGLGNQEKHMLPRSRASWVDGTWPWRASPCKSCISVRPPEVPCTRTSARGAALGGLTHLTRQSGSKLEPRPGPSAIQCNCHHHHQILGLRLHSLPASRAAPAVLSPGPFPRRQASQRKPRNLELAVAAFDAEESWNTPQHQVPQRCPCIA